MERDREKIMCPRMQELLQSGLTLGMNSSPSDSRKKDDSRAADGIFNLGNPSLKTRLADGKLGPFGEKGNKGVSDKSLRREVEVMSGTDERRSATNASLHFDSRMDAVRSMTSMGLLSETNSAQLQPSGGQAPPLFRQGVPSQRNSPPSDMVPNPHMNDGQQKSFSSDHSSKPQQSPMESPKRSMSLHGPEAGQQPSNKSGQRRRTPNIRESKGMLPAGSAQQHALQQQALQQFHQQQHALQQIGYHQHQHHHQHQHQHQTPIQHPQDTRHLQYSYKGGLPNVQPPNIHHISASQHLEVLQQQVPHLSGHSLKIEPVELERSASVDPMQLDRASAAERLSPPESTSTKDGVSVADTQEMAKMELKRMSTDESKPSISLGSAAESKDSVRSGSHREGGDRESLHPQSQSSGRTSRENMFADLNAEPPASDGEDEGLLTNDGAHMVAQPESSRTTTEEKRKRRKAVKDPKFFKEGDEVDNKKVIKPAKSRAKPKLEVMMDSGLEGDGYNHLNGVPTTKEERIKSLKVGLIHVTKKLPKNAHAHFTLGLMHQRSGHCLKAAQAYRQAAEILKLSEDETGQSRSQFMATIQVHQAQCLLEESFGGQVESGKELVKEELECVVSKLKEATQVETGQAAVWSTLGLLLLRAGKNQSAKYVLTSLLEVVPDHLDALSNLGVAYLHSGELANAARCFQLVLEKDRSHPGAFVNYAALLLRQYGSSFAGVGAGAGPEAYATRLGAARAAQKCLEAALKEDPKAGHAWANLASAHSALGNIGNASQCLEQAAKLEPTRMSVRYAVAAHRIKDAERCEDAAEQLGWAANEMSSILREGDCPAAQPCLGWAGLAMVNRAQHESAAAFEEGGIDLKAVEERAIHTLQQAIEEDPQDAVQWHQMGLHTLCTLQFGAAQNYLKTAISRRRVCTPAWTNLGIALQLSEDPSLAEGVYKEALAHAPTEQAHSIHSNLGNLYRQQRRFSEAHESFRKCLELCPDYAPACNNLGLLLVAENKWQEAIDTFDKALMADPCLDAAKSNRMKAVALAQMRGHVVDTKPPFSNPAPQPAEGGMAIIAPNPPIESATLAVSNLSVHSPSEELMERDPFPLPSVS